MPFRMLLDSGTVHPADAVLVVPAISIRPRSSSSRPAVCATRVDEVGAALEGADAAYFAFDVDVLDPDERGGLLHARAGRLHRRRGRRPAPQDRRRTAGCGYRLHGPGRPRRTPRRSPAWPLPPASKRGRAPRTKPRYGGDSKMARMESRVDVTVENRGARPADGGKRHPNTCPRCHSHYRDDELEQTLRVCPQCGHHFPVRARERIAQLADRGTFVEEDAGLRSADPRASSTCGPTRTASPRPRSRPGSGRHHRGGRRHRAATVRACGHGLCVHGRLDGKHRREKFARASERAAANRSPSSASPPRAVHACRRGFSRSCSFRRTVSAVDELREARCASSP